MDNKSIKINVLSTLVVILALSLALGFYSNHRVAQAHISQESNEFSEEELLEFQKQMFDIMSERGINPGTMMGGEAMSWEDFNSWHEEMEELMEHYGLTGGMMGPGMMGSGMMNLWR